MANDLNQCTFTGRLGRDVDMKYLPSGDAVASMALAVGSQWKDKNTGDKQEAVEWVNAVAFGKTAELAGQYLSKGSQLLIVGRMKTEKYQAKDGSDRYTTKVIVDRLQFLGGNKSEASSASAPAPAPKPAPAQSAPDFDDDVPF